MTGMTYKEVSQMIRGTGLQYAYYSFPTDQAPPLPYVVYFYPNRNDMMADDENYVRVETLIVELYTETKDFDTEGTIETAFTNNHITYDKTETFINSENMYQCYYETQIVIVPEPLQ